MLVSQHKLCSFLHVLHLQPALCFTSSILSQFSTSQVQILVTNYLVMNFSGIRLSLALYGGLRTSNAITVYCRTFSAAVETKPARGNTVFLQKIWEYGWLYFHWHCGALLSRFPFAKILKFISFIPTLYYVLIKVFLCTLRDKAM